MKHRQHSFFAQVFPLFLVLTFLPLLALSIYSTSSVRNFVAGISRYELLENLYIIAGRLEAEWDAGADWMASLKDMGQSSRIRLTLIQRDGAVLYDSREAIGSMENHVARPEIRDAFEKGSGSDHRRSATLDVDSTYAAVRLNLPGYTGSELVLRSSLPLNAVSDQFNAEYTGLAMVMVWILLAGGLVAFLLARQIRKPVLLLEQAATAWAQGNFDQRLHIVNPVEFAKLADVMNAMADQLRLRLQALRSSREELQTIMTAMGEALMVTDRHGRLAFWNPEARRLFAMEESKADAPAPGFLDVCRSPELSALEIRCRNGQREECGLTIYHPRYCHLQVHGAPLPDGSGAVLVISDVTRMVQLETVRKDFVANVSHELKTPIQSIRGFTETLLESAGEDPASREKFLNIILRNTLRMEAIIGDLLTLARLEHLEGSGVPSPELCTVSELVNRAVDDLANHGRLQGRTITTSGSAEQTLRVNIGLVEQAIVNLLDNAVRYTPAECPVSIAWRADGGFVELEVRDQGPGIPERDQDRIFERFYRLDKSRGRETGGTGLGLAIVRHVMQLHQGSVSLESRNGEGCRFVMRFLAP